MPRTATQRKTAAQPASKKKIPQTKSSLKLVPTPKGSTYVKPADMDWKPTPYKGIKIKVLYQDKAKGELTCLLKWEPGSSLPFHKHPEIEQSWVLEGSFYDHDGIARAGEYVWRRPGSFHQTYSDEGTVILAIYRKPNVFYNTAGGVRAGYDT
jgi:anti-sigma factor ChrR (cupin superfamily)